MDAALSLLLLCAGALHGAMGVGGLLLAQATLLALESFAVCWLFIKLLALAADFSA